MDSDIIIKLCIIGLVIYATSLHELAHAFIANHFGDPTPGRHGRLTFDPIPHLSPMLTAIVLPILFYMFNGTLFCLATTPINPSKFRRPLRDHALVALGGPLMNLLFAGVLFGILYIPGAYRLNPLYAQNPITGEPLNYLTAILPEAALWNLILAAFNLLPIPPLDGYWIARGALPLKMRMQTDAIARSPAALMLAMFGGSAVLNLFIAHIYVLWFSMLPTPGGF